MLLILGARSINLIQNLKSMFSGMVTIETITTCLKMATTLANIRSTEFGTCRLLMYYT